MNSPRSHRENPKPSLKTSRAALVALLATSSAAACAPNMVQQELAPLTTSAHREITAEERTVDQVARRALEADRVPLSVAITNNMHANGMGRYISEEVIYNQLVGVTDGDALISTQRPDGIHIYPYRISYRNPEAQAGSPYSNVDFDLSLAVSPQTGGPNSYTVRMTERGVTRTLQYTSRR